MSRRIVVIPSFAASHLLRCWIPNILETLDPDAISINEGLMQKGPEDKGHLDAVISKFLYCKNGVYRPACGFDMDETEEICKNYGDLIQLHDLQYPFDMSAVDCFKSAISFFGQLEPEPGDIIFCLEPDALLLESDKEIINDEISKLKPGEGISCKWMDFLETQFYTEAINLVQPKFRRFAYCFDNLENYLDAMGSGFMTQNYPKLKRVDSFFIRHYCWFQPGKWKELRFDLIHRSDPNYWKDFEKGLQEIRYESEIYADGLKNDTLRAYPEPKILIRPSRQDEGRWAQFIDIQHPKAIMNHENFVK